MWGQAKVTVAYHAIPPQLLFGFNVCKKIHYNKKYQNDIRYYGTNDIYIGLNDFKRKNIV